MTTYEVVTIEHSKEELLCHPASSCAGYVCDIHNRTDHPMRRFRQHWSRYRRIMERICPHGVGHPDPDDRRIRDGLDAGVHGCDGCCREGGYEELNGLDQSRLDREFTETGVSIPDGWRFLGVVHRTGWVSNNVEVDESAVWVFDGASEVAFYHDREAFDVFYAEKWKPTVESIEQLCREWNLPNCWTVKGLDEIGNDRLQYPSKAFQNWPSRRKRERLDKLAADLLELPLGFWTALGVDRRNVSAAVEALRSP